MFRHTSLQSKNIGFAISQGKQAHSQPLKAKVHTIALPHLGQAGYLAQSLRFSLFISCSVSAKYFISLS